MMEHCLQNFGATCNHFTRPKLQLSSILLLAGEAFLLEATMPEGAFYGQEGASWEQDGSGMRVAC